MMSIIGYNPHKHDISLSYKNEKKLKEIIKGGETVITKGCKNQKYLKRKPGFKINGNLAITNKPKIKTNKTNSNCK